MDNEKTITLKLEVKGQEKFNKLASDLKKGLSTSSKLFETFATKTLPESTKALNKFNSSIKRIAVYRAIRFGLKFVTNAFKEGTQNIYRYSEALSKIGRQDTSNAFQTLNNYSSAFLQLKNSIGAAVAPILQALLPAVIALTDWFIKLFNAASAFFTLVNGTTQNGKFTGAVKATSNYLEDSVGSAKELKKTLLGFDELNVLNDNSRGGGGSNKLDTTNMFALMDVPETVTKFKIILDDVLFEWKNLNGEKIAQKAIAGLSALCGAVAGFSLFGAPGAVAGAILGVAMGVYIDTLTFDNDGTLSSVEVATGLKYALGALVGGAIGFMIGGVGGTGVGAMLGMAVTAATQLDVNGVKFKAVTGLDRNKVLPDLAGVLTGAMAGMLLFKPFGIAGVIAGVAFGISASAGVRFILSDLVTKGDGTVDYSKFIDDMCGSLTLMCGAIGLKFGGLTGGLIGITVGAALTLIISSVTTGWTAESKRKLDDVGIKKEDLTRRIDILSNYNKNDLQPRAAGGMVTPGSMFIAGERGAELITATSNGVNVSTRDQIADSVASGNEGIINALFAVANQLTNTINSQDYGSDVYIGDRDIVRAYDRGKRLMGNTLVEV